MMLPVRTTLDEWAASLIIDFPTDNIPMLSDEKDWKSWGSALVQTISFSKNGAPDPNDYNDDEVNRWMEDVFKAMADF